VVQPPGHKTVILPAYSYVVVAAGRYAKMFSRSEIGTVRPDLAYFFEYLR